MGTLRSRDQDVFIDEHGNEFYTPSVKGYSYNGIVFGDPAEIDGDPLTYGFDHSLFLNGTVEIIDGQVVVTVDEPDDAII